MNCSNWGTGPMSCTPSSYFNGSIAFRRSLSVKKHLETRESVYNIANKSLYKSVTECHWLRLVVSASTLNASEQPWDAIVYF